MHNELAEIALDAGNLAARLRAEVEAQQALTPIIDEALQVTVKLDRTQAGTLSFLLMQVSRDTVDGTPCYRDGELRELWHEVSGQVLPQLRAGHTAGYGLAIPGED